MLIFDENTTSPWPKERKKKFEFEVSDSTRSSRPKLDSTRESIESSLYSFRPYKDSRLYSSQYTAAAILLSDPLSSKQVCVSLH